MDVFILYKALSGSAAFNDVSEYFVAYLPIITNESWIMQITFYNLTIL